MEIGTSKPGDQCHLSKMLNSTDTEVATKPATIYHFSQVVARLVIIDIENHAWEYLIKL